MIVTITNLTGALLYVSLLRRSLNPGEAETLQPITAPQLEQEIQLLDLVNAGSLHMDVTLEPTDSIVPAVEPGVAVVDSDGDTLQGDGTLSNKLAIKAVKHDSSITGSGTTGSPLAIAVQHDSSLAGSGTSGSQLSALPVKYAPSHTLTVAQGFPSGFDTTINFTTFAAALTQAATLSPVFASQVGIDAAPISSTETLALLSNCGIVGRLAQGTAINGNVTWQPGVGINSSQASLQECFHWEKILHAQASTTLTIDASGKASGSTQFYAYNCPSIQQIACTGRGVAGDNFFAFNTNFGSNTCTWTNMVGSAQSIGVELVSCRSRGLTFAGNTFGRIEGGDHVSGTIALTGTANLIINGLAAVGNITVASGCTLSIDAGRLASGSTITSSSGASVDIGSLDYGPITALVGPGPINRAKYIFTTTTTSAGNNTIDFTSAHTGIESTTLVPYLDANYHVVATQLTGTASTYKVTGLTANGFTFVDTGGGNTWSIMITHL